jgi:hypothetical protein
MPSGAWTGLAIIVISCLALIVTMLVARNERLKLEFEREYHLMLSEHAPSAQDGQSIGGSPSLADIPGYPVAEPPDDEWLGDVPWDGPSLGEDALRDSPSLGQDALLALSPPPGEDAVLQDAPPLKEGSSSADSASPESGTSSPNAAPSAGSAPSGEG